MLYARVLSAACTADRRPLATLLHFSHINASAVRPHGLLLTPPWDVGHCDRVVMHLEHRVHAAYAWA
jgi:hypothetical protein